MNDGCNNSSVRSLKSTQVFDNINTIVDRINSTSPISHSPNSYAAWREQNYTREANSRNTTRASSLCKNIHSYNHALQSDASVQKQQDQDKIYDIPKQRVNVRTNDGIYEKCVKFTCLDVGNSYNLDRETHSSTSKNHLSCNSVQKAKFNISDHNMEMPNKTIPNTLKGTEHLQMPYTGCQQLHVSNHSNCNNIDNNETVKTLLQIVNSQSEQIKNLQLQIDRLVRMQEESLRNKSTCSCSSTLANQVLKYPSINCYDSAHNSPLVQSQKDMKKNEGIQNTSAIEKKDLIFGENNKLETALLEQQSKKTFVEQKVSIGVMTSFEFTVQNSPFILDSEIYEKKEVCRESNNINRRNAVNIPDATESVKRYTFTRKTGAAQLENIVEDSESHLSSNQQQSSNFNVNSSVKDSERHTLKESDIYNAVNTSESSKMYQYLATDLNRKEMHKGVYTEEDNTNEQVQDTRKVFNESMNVECSPRNINYNKKLVSEKNDYTTINREKDAANINANKYFVYNTHLPVTDYYEDHRNKKYDTDIKQIKDVDSMILSGGDLKILERPPPTPEPSIHVEMQEYTSDDDSDKLKHTPKIGWTFYDNVLGQVNEILQNSSVTDKTKNQSNAKIVRKVEQENDMEPKTALNTVKAATLEQLRKLGISVTENNEYRESNSNNKTYVSISIYTYILIIILYIYIFFCTYLFYLQVNLHV